VARPVIASYSGKIVDFGPKIGSAQTMKLVNNVLVTSNLVLAAEAMLLGLKGGLDSEKMLEVLSVGTGQNYAITSIIAQHVFSRSFDFGGALNIVAKDYDCIVAEAEKLSVPLDASQAVQKIVLAALGRHGGGADFTALVRDLEDRVGVAFPKTREAPARS